MGQLHTLLRRQLKRHFGNGREYPKSLKEFIESVNEAYVQSDDDRLMLERSLELSSQELLQANSELRALFHALPDLVFRLSADGTILDFKAGRTSDLYSLPQRLKGKKIQDVPDREVGVRFQEAVCSMRASRQMVNFEYSLTIDGKRHIYEARLLPLQGDEIIVVVRNVTEREEAVAQIKHGISLLSATLESTADGIVVKNFEGKVVSYNQRFLEMWRIPRELAEKGEDRLLLEHVQDQLNDPVEFVKRNEALCIDRESENHDTIEFKDGRIYERYSLPQRMGGVSVGRVYSYRDITLRTQLENELRHRQKMEAIGQLAGGVAHDFNNVLASILGYARLALEDVPESNPLNDDLKQIVTAGERGRELVEQIMAFSRRSITTGRKAPHQLTDIVKESLKLLRPTLPSTIEIKLTLPPQMPLVTVDSTQVHQVIVNLCLNAAQAMPNGGRLSISLNAQRLGRQDCNRLAGGSGKRTLTPGHYVVLSAQDTGCGIPKEILPRIFEPFFSTKTGGPGMGMGLALVYGIVEGHAGEIVVHSEPGRGTTVRVYWATTETAPFAIPAPEGPVRGGNESVLVVDDEEALGKMIGRTLTRLGYRVVVETDPVCAVELFRESPQRFDLVVTDQTMPVMTGDKVAEELHRIRPDLPIILCSGYSEVLTPEREAEVRISAIVHKPFSEDRLGKEVRAILDSSTREPSRC